MVLFWKAAAGALITVVLGLALGKSRDFSMLLSLAACTMISILALTYLEPILEFIRELEGIRQLQGDMLSILLKAAGIGLVAEIAAVRCADAGNASLGNSLQLLGTGVILCLSLPILRTMLDLIQMILGEI